jgi:hypothetical protein
MEMGRLVRLRRRHSPVVTVKETVAALSEEIEFTLNYAQAMTREQNYHAAAEVIEEQRRSLADVERKIHEVVVEPLRSRSQFRMRAALAGVAATLAIASGALAGLQGASHAPNTNARIEAIQQTTEALNRATGISDPQTLQAIVIDAQNTLLDVARSAPGDPTVKQPLLDTIEKLKRVIGNPNVPARVREQAKKVADTVHAIVEAPTASSTPTPAPAPGAPTGSTNAPATAP